jgi:hypothetical protein
MRRAQRDSAEKPSKFELTYSKAQDEITFLSLGNIDGKRNRNQYNSVFF